MAFGNAIANAAFGITPPLPNILIERSDPTESLRSEHFTWDLFRGLRMGRAWQAHHHHGNPCPNQQACTTHGHCRIRPPACRTSYGMCPAARRLGYSIILQRTASSPDTLPASTVLSITAAARSGPDREPATTSTGTTDWDRPPSACPPRADLSYRSGCCCTPASRTGC